MAIKQKPDIIATWIAGLLLISVFVLMWYAQKQFSPVYDEVANIPSGYNYLTTNRYTDATHPPFLRYLMAVPMYVQHADPLPNDSTALYRWQSYGTHFLFQNNQPWQQILSGTRLVNIFLSLFLLGFLYYWTRLLWGWKAALVGLAFMAFEPTFLGHGQLATLDLGFSLMYFVASWSLWCYLKNPNWRNYWWINLCFGLAFLSKFAAIPLYFVAILCFILFKKQQVLSLKRFWLSPALLLFLTFAVYLFQMKSPANDAQISMARDSVKIQAQLDKIAGDLGTTRTQMLSVQIPAYDFWKGFGMQVFHAMFQDVWEKKESFQYLNGDYSRRGWRTYFCWTFLLKSTISSILLLVMVLFFWGNSLIKKRAESNHRLSITAACLCLPPLLLFIACSLGTINIGHRYILPIYPFLAMGIGYLTTLVSPKLQRIVLILIVLHIISSLSAWPHHLTYFNELSRRGYHLADSNIDWGQDMLFLKRDLETPRVQETKIWGDCFGVVQPINFGIELNTIPTESREQLGSGKHTIYLSIHRYLNKSSVHPKGLYPWLNAYEPTRKVGSSILVYEID